MLIGDYMEEAICVINHIDEYKTELEKLSGEELLSWKRLEGSDTAQNNSLEQYLEFARQVKDVQDQDSVALGRLFAAAKLDLIPYRPL